MAVLHSGLTQNQREDAIASVREGDNEILCCTDIGARGIDLPNVSLVLNYQFPTNFASYIHRIGACAILTRPYRTCGQEWQRIHARRRARRGALLRAAPRACKVARVDGSFRAGTASSCARASALIAIHIATYLSTAATSERRSAGSSAAICAAR